MYQHRHSKCEQVSRAAEEAVSEKCIQCHYEDLVRSMAERNRNEEEKGSGDRSRVWGYPWCWDDAFKSLRG